MDATEPDGWIHIGAAVAGAIDRMAKAYAEIVVADPAKSPELEAKDGH